MAESAPLPMLAMDMIHLYRDFRGANDMRRNDTVPMPQWIRRSSPKKIEKCIAVIDVIGIVQRELSRLVSLACSSSRSMQGACHFGERRRFRSIADGAGFRLQSVVAARSKLELLGMFRSGVNWCAARFS
jgi:hypothetical protein